MKHFTEMLRFASSGAIAALIHFLIVCALVPAGLHPLSANLLAFLSAFQFSYVIHSRWTFRSAPRGGYLRLFAVSSTAFLANEILYAILLKSGVLGYRTALALVLILVSGATYLASKFWVFPASRPCP